MLPMLMIPSQLDDDSQDVYFTQHHCRKNLGCSGIVSAWQSHILRLFSGQREVRIGGPSSSPIQALSSPLQSFSNSLRPPSSPLKSSSSPFKLIDPSNISFWLRSSSHGWLATAGEKSTTIVLVNPFRNALTIRLPPLDFSPTAFTDEYNIYKVILTADSISNPDSYIIVAISIVPIDN